MFGMRELIAYLAQFEISPRRAMEVFRTFGPGAMQAIAANPYLLCGEPLQLDFRHADSICPVFTTWKATAPSGWKRPCCAPCATTRATATPACRAPSCWKRHPILSISRREKLAAALDECIRTEELRVKLFDGTPYIYLPDLLEAEEDIAARLAMLTKTGQEYRPRAG